VCSMRADRFSPQMMENPNHLGLVLGCSVFHYELRITISWTKQSSLSQVETMDLFQVYASEGRRRYPRVHSRVLGPKQSISAVVHQQR